MRYVFAFMLAAALAPATASVLAAEPDWDQVGQALGKPGAVQPGGVYRVALPRSDLKVTLDGLALQPGFALGGWVAFEPMGGQCMVMGDLVLTQDEVTPVMRKLVADGFEITALHNHLLRAEPATPFMHVSATGDADKLAGELHDALVLSKTPLSAGPAPASQPRLDLDTAALDKAMGYQGKASARSTNIRSPAPNR